MAGLAGAVDALTGVDWAGMPVAERLAVLAELEASARRLAAVSGAVMASLAVQPPEALGNLKPANLIADVLRVTPAAARERLRIAGLVAGRVSLTGQPMPPLLPRTAEPVAGGSIDAAHVAVIAKFLGGLPEAVGPRRGSGPKGFWPSKPCWCVRISWTSSRPGLRRTSTPTAPSPTSTGHVSVGWSSGGSTPMACRRSRAG